jgi:hypothetical protein
MLGISKATASLTLAISTVSNLETPTTNCTKQLISRIQHLQIRNKSTTDATVCLNTPQNNCVRTNVCTLRHPSLLRLATYEDISTREQRMLAYKVWKISTCACFAQCGTAMKARRCSARSVECCPAYLTATMNSVHTSSYRARGQSKSTQWMTIRSNRCKIQWVQHDMIR